MAYSMAGVKWIAIQVFVFFGVVLIDVHAFSLELTALLGLLMILVVPFLLLLACFLAFKRRIEAAWLSGITGFLIVVGFFVGSMINRSKVDATREISLSIILALESYKKVHDQYPEKLHELVPSYLQNIPRTSLGLFAHPPFKYYREDDWYCLSFQSPYWMVNTFFSDQRVWIEDD